MKGKKKSLKQIIDSVESNAKERRKMFLDLLKHVESGLSLDCFKWLSVQTIKEYMKKYPQEFVAEELILAQRMGKDGWERIGRRQSDGNCIGNSRSWQYNMINRYGWTDKLEVDANIKGSVNVSVVSYASRKACSDSESDH